MQREIIANFNKLCVVKSSLCCLLRRTTRNLRRQGPNPLIKGTLKLYKDDTVVKCCFTDSYGGNTVGGLLILLLLKVNDSYCYMLSW